MSFGPNRMIPDASTVAALIREVAASEILPRFRRLEARDITEKKSPTDLVTTADIEAERWLTRALTVLLPGSVVVGEEAAEGDPDMLLALAGDDPVWLVDPVDGTRNFVRHDPRFAVIVALCVAGETRAGWILDPVSDVLAWAVEGQGAWLDDAKGRHRLQVSAAKPIGEMTGSLGAKLGNRMRARATGGVNEAPKHIVRYGCTGQEYLDLARGVLDFARYHRLKPWDHAAGVLIHAEAGGYGAIAEDGRPYRPEPRIAPDTVMVAPDRASWNALRTALDDAMQTDMSI